MNRVLTLICLLVGFSQLSFSQCPVEGATCQGSSPCVEIDFSQTTLTESNGNCVLDIVVSLVQGSGGGSTIKKMRIGVVPLAGAGTKQCHEFFDIESGTTSLSHTFTFPGACINNEPIDIVVEGYTCLNNDNCCCGREIANSLQVLPVEISSFTGVAQKNENVISWTTQSEENALLFSVEKSLDGRKDFRSIGEVMASGDSDTPRNYFFMDKDPLRRNYYRLKSIDNDGSIQYSDLLFVQRKDISFSFLDVFPVPAEDRATAIIQAENETSAEVILYNLQGQKIIHRRQDLTEGINRIDLDWKKGSDTMYFLTVFDGKDWITQKIILTKTD